jgi:signal transduction histidine kinase
VLARLTSWETSADLPRGMLADVQMLRRNIELEARLIDDMLDLNRIAKGHLSLNLELVDVHELIEMAVSMLQSQIKVKRLKVALDLNAARHFVKADSARIQQILINVLSNAAKFTERDGHISVTTEDDIEGRIVTRIKDDGIGMSREVLERLFRPFEQGTDIGKQYGGLGLGLAISKALVDVQVGTITADSRGPGNGAEITITFPSIHATATAKLAATSRRDGRARRALRILFVEDHEDSAYFISQLLRERGHDVVTCGTLAEALDTAENQEFDLLLK